MGLCLLPLAMHAATFVQTASSAPSSPMAQVSVPFQSAEASGDMNIVVVGWNDNTAAVKSVKDSAGNLYQLAVGPTVGNGVEQSIYYSPNVKSGSNTVTVTFSQAATYPDIRVMEYKGVGSLDTAAGESGNSSSTSSGAATTKNPADLIFASNTVATWFGQVGSGFTMRLITSDSDIAEDRTTTAAGSYTATATLGKSGPWVMQMAAFSPATGTTTSGTTTAALSGITCSSSSLTGSGTDGCAVALTAAAPSGGLTVALASSSSALSVPASVTVGAGATGASFSASAAAVSAAQTATLTASEGGASKTFAISLNAAKAALAVGSASVSFGSVDLNSPATQSVTLTSSGTAPVTISGASLSGTGFSISGQSPPLTLNPGQTATLNVQFDPTVAGAAKGTVTLTDNASPSTMAISLSGTGVAAAYAVELSWGAPGSSSDPATGYNVYRAVSGSSSYQLLNSSPNGTTTYTDSTVTAGASYTYYVESVDAQGNLSSPSTTYSATIP